MKKDTAKKRRKESDAAHMLVGRRGEDIARIFLRNKGYSILRKNERINRHDEIDIIAYDPADRVVVFVEVKTRSRSSAEYHPALNATYKKRTSMIRAARAWVALHNWDDGYRMDLISIMNNRVTDHIVELPWKHERAK